MVHSSTVGLSFFSLKVTLWLKKYMGLKSVINQLGMKIFMDKKLYHVAGKIANARSSCKHACICPYVEHYEFFVQMVNVYSDAYNTNEKSISNHGEFL